MPHPADPFPPLCERGFQIGGPDWQSIARAYYEAAKIVSKADVIYVQPLRFLYRHSIEVSLKGILYANSIQFTKDHLLEDLYSKLPLSVSGETAECIRGLNEIDPLSTAERFPFEPLTKKEIEKRHARTLKGKRTHPAPVRSRRIEIENFVKRVDCACDELLEILEDEYIRLMVELEATETSGNP